MKDSALVVADVLCDEAVEKALRTIDRLTAGTEADESGIHSTYPILFFPDRGQEVPEALQPYVKDYLTFSGEDGLNPAGQSLVEVLRLLDIQHVFVCGSLEHDTAGVLLKEGFDVQEV